MGKWNHKVSFTHGATQVPLLIWKDCTYKYLVMQLLVGNVPSPWGLVLGKVFVQVQVHTNHSKIRQSMETGILLQNWFKPSTGSVLKAMQSLQNVQWEIAKNKYYLQKKVAQLLYFKIF